MSEISPDDLPHMPALALGLAGPLVILLRSTMARKTYIRLAAASGTDQIREVVDQGLLNLAGVSGYVLSPNQMADETA